MKTADRQPHSGFPSQRIEVMTLLFTDLVGSVNLKRKLGNLPALELFAQHDRIVRTLLSAFPDAQEISTAGDSFFLAFRRPSDAVCFALRLLERLREWNRNNPLPIADRIGIHAGEVAVETDAHGGIRDLKGFEVDKCARVMSLAGANQIFLTEFACENAQSFLEGVPLPTAGPLRWVTHGRYRLKGIPDPVEIREVGEVGHARFAPPRGANRKPAWLGAAVTACVGLAALVLPPAEPISEVSYDLAYMFRPEQKPTDAVLVVTDSESHTNLGQQFYASWDRSIHAQLLDRLRAYGARAVAFDIIFDLADTNRPQSDRAFVDAVRRHGKVVLAGLVKPRDEAVFEGDTFVPPFAELAAVAPWGLVAFKDRVGSAARRPYLGDPGRGKQSLASEMVRLLEGRALPRREVWLNYYGPPGTIESFRYWQVLSNTIPASHFTNKLVFVGDINDERIGPTGGWRTDEAPTPYSLWTRKNSSGVEIVATTTLNLLRPDWLRRLSPWTEVALVVLLGAVAGFGFTRLSPFMALAAGTAGGLLVALVAMLLVWRTLVWFPWLVVSAVQLPVAFLWSLLAWTYNAPRRQTTTRVLAQSPSAARPPPPPSGDLRPPGSAARTSGGTEPTPTIPNYTLHREIGRGAYGQVWLVRDTVGLWRALKIVRRAAFSSPRPYEREFAGIQRFTPISLEHPGLVRVLHVGRGPGDEYFYYVMELADAAPPPGRLPEPGDPPDLKPHDRRAAPDPAAGSYSPRSLASDLQARGPLPAAEVQEIGVHLADALDFLHQHGLIHRDVKPANVLFVGGRPKLADIGLVTALAEAGREVSWLGTPGYMPPEGPGTAAGDVYSLGKLLYVAATGRAPTDFPELPEDFDRRSDQESLAELSRLWCRACEPEATRRPVSAAAFAAALRKRSDGTTAEG